MIAAFYHQIKATLLHIYSESTPRTQQWVKIVAQVKLREYAHRSLPKRRPPSASLGYNPDA
jgi:hypothetical protein